MGRYHRETWKKKLRRYLAFDYTHSILMHYPEVGFTHSEMLPYEHLDLTIEGPQGCTSNSTTTRSQREMLRYLQMLESPQADPIPGGTEGLRHEPLSVPSFPSQLL